MLYRMLVSLIFAFSYCSIFVEKNNWIFHNIIPFWFYQSLISFNCFLSFIVHVFFCYRRWLLFLMLFIVNYILAFVSNYFLTQNSSRKSLRSHSTISIPRGIGSYDEYWKKLPTNFILTRKPHLSTNTKLHTSTPTSRYVMHENKPRCFMHF